MIGAVGLVVGGHTPPFVSRRLSRPSAPTSPTIQNEDHVPHQWSAIAREYPPPARPFCSKVAIWRTRSRYEFAVRSSPRFDRHTVDHIGTLLFKMIRTCRRSAGSGRLSFRLPVLYRTCGPGGDEGPVPLKEGA